MLGLGSAVSARPPLLVAAALLFLWLLAETASRLYARHQGSAPPSRSSADRGSFFGIILATYVGVGLAVGFYLNGVGPSLPAWSLEAGAGVALVGVVVRSWAIVTLGRFFSVIIRIDRGHELVQTGPYRWVRHPSYSGLLLSLWGMALVLGTVLGVACVVAASTLACLYRMTVEERMLHDRFGPEYDAYAQRTWRLFPGMY